MFVLMSVTIIVIYVVRKFVQNCKYYYHLRCFPKVHGWPIIGVMPDYYDPKHALSNSMKYAEKYGPNILLNIGEEILVITEPKLMEVVLNSQKVLTKSPEYRLANLWLGNGLLTSTGAKWRSHRKLLTPSFHYNILKDFVDVFNESSEKLVKKLRMELGTQSFDLYKYITLHTLDIICETAMGCTANAQDDENSVFVKSVEAICEIMYSKTFSITGRLDWLYPYTKMYKREVQVVKELHSYSNSIIKNRRKMLLRSDAVQIDQFGMKGKHTFLDILLLSSVNGIPLTDEEIREEVDTFIFEGHDTTAVAICFALYCLSNNADIQKKTFEEVKQIVEDNSGWSYESLQNMKYLEMVIKETLRLYPSVPVFGRIVTEDIKYEGGILPKGLIVGLVPYVMHRNPDIYEDPEKFCPERFLPKNVTERHPYSYVSFSAGPRNCIGQKFAMLELKSTISKILLSYELLPAFPEHKLKMTTKVTLQSLSGINIQLKERGL